MARIQMVCERCGSSDVRRNADCAWSVESQSWEIVALLDDTCCETCGRERDLVEIPVE